MTGTPKVRAFAFAPMPARVLFGSGTLDHAGGELERLGIARALVLSTPEQAGGAAALAERLGDRAAGTCARAAMHTPVEVTEAAREDLRASGADGLVSFGGGSTVGLGKALAVRTGLPHLAIPTTYAGSEMTDILGESAGGGKTTRRAEAIRPAAVIYDVDLTLTLPVALSVTSALNALAHAVEGLYAPDCDPVTRLMAREACGAVAVALPRVVEAPDDREARGELLYAAWLCATVLGRTSMALHHKLAHVVGGAFGTPHAQTHAILLPHTAGFNAAATGEALAPLADAFGAPVGPALHRFARSVGAPTALRDLGVREDDIPRAAALAVKNPYANPRPFGQDDIETLLRAAWEGAPPPE